MKNDKKRTAWTPAQLLNLSQALAESYGFNQIDKPRVEQQGWTTEKLLKLSAAKSL